MAVIRQAREEDSHAIAAFTQDTFVWGDYVPSEFPRWLERENTCVVVAVDESDKPIALARGSKLSEVEAWLASARVHPDHRRRGLATALNDWLMDWAAQWGARVGRLAIEEWNEAASSQVENLGFRSVSRWAFASRSAERGDPQVPGNGGRRRASGENLAPAGAEAEAAYLAWSSGDLSADARGMYPIGWSWRMMELADAHAAAAENTLYECRSGWAIAYPWTGGGEPNALWVSWLVTAEEDAPGLLRALLDLAADTDFKIVQCLAPATGWLIEAMEAARFEVNPVAIYERLIEASGASQRYR